MSTFASLVSVHLAGEGNDEISLDTLPGKFTVTRTDEALTPYGGLAAWSGFLKHLGIIERLAEHCPVARTSPNGAPVREVLHSFLLGALVEGKCFCHVRWVMDDPAVATLMGMDRVRGEDALPRLGKGLDRENLRHWMNRPHTELYAALPDRFIADWDATVNTRYGHQEDAAAGYNPHKRGRKSHHPLICVAARTRLEPGTTDRHRAHAQAHQSQSAGFVLGHARGRSGGVCDQLGAGRRDARTGGAALRATGRHGERV